ncbi:MAG TPA: AMP-binding protein [Candidatus Elarobacter sp.]
MDPVRHDSIGVAVRRSVVRVPHEVALRFGERTWTYEALDRGANRIARSLMKAGLAPGARLAAYGRNSDAYFLAWLGCVRAGVIHVPVNYALRPEELGYIVRQCGASGVVCDEALSASVAASAARRPGRDRAVKDIINTGGVVVSSRDVEEALFTHPSVYECAVIALPDPKWIAAVTAIVALRPGAQATEDELIEHAGTTLAPFKVPKRVIFAETLPRNTAGKVLKRELRTTYG